MTSLKRAITVVLLVVAALTAVRAPAFANDGHLRMSAHQSCHCQNDCAPANKACKEHGSCAAMCGAGALVADIGVVTFVAGTHHSAAPDRIAVLTTLTYPPPLHPPRA